MNRKLLRITLIGLVALVAFAAAWPALSGAVGFKVQSVRTTPLAAGLGHSNYRGECLGTKPGITLVVDYGALRSGQPEVRCAINRGSAELTGWSLFLSAGLKVTGTSDYPTGFVCRIDGLPSAAQQDCLHTPTTAEGTWQYFTASRTGGWHFSMVGSAMSHPKCGDYQGWRFVKNSDGNGPHLPRVTPKPFSCD